MLQSHIGDDSLHVNSTEMHRSAIDEIIKNFLYYLSNFNANSRIIIVNNSFIVSQPGSL